jgi:hypothetical protein
MGNGFICCGIGDAIGRFVLVKSVFFDIVHHGTGQQVSDRQAPPQEQADLLTDRIIANFGE